MVCANFTCLAVRLPPALSASSRARISRLLSGVRSSCDIFARNCDFASLARSAASLASSSSAVRRLTRDSSSLIAASSWRSAAQSTRPVNTSVATNSSSSARASCSGWPAKGPRFTTSVYQSAMAQTAATAVVTPRWPKRNAAQTTNGTMRKVRAPLPWNTICAAPSRSTPNTAASARRRGCQRSLPAQLRMSGVKISTPQASPCHQVDQLPRSSLGGMR